MMRRALRFLAAVAVIAQLSSGIALAAVPPKLSLADAQRIALQNHPDVRTIQLDAQAAQEAVNIARSAYAPQAEGSAVSAFAAPGLHVASPPIGITNPSVYQRTAAGVSLSQYITDFGRTGDLVKSYELTAEAEKDRGQETRLTVVLNATQAYFQVLRAQALLQVAQETLSERDTLFRQIDQLARAGLRSTLDVSIAQRDVSSARQAIIAARASVRDSQATLSEALGSPDETRYTLENVQALPAIPKAVGPLLDEVIGANPELSAMSADAAAAQAQAKAVARETSPTISAYGYFGAAPIRSANDAINDAYATAGVAMNVPIINGGELRAARRQADFRAQAAYSSFTSLRNSLLRDTRVAFDDVQAARGNIDATDQIVKTAMTAERLTRARYRIGLSTIVDLSEAELAVTQAQIDHTNAIYDYIEQGAGLEFLTGALMPATPP